jgi:uroporphyrinogen-III synthase
MRLLITRPRDDSDALAEILHARGHVPIVAPLMEVRFHEGPPLALDGVQAVLASSANGVRALALRTPRREVTLFAVGPQTAQAARAHGFADVIDADGDAQALAEKVASACDPAAGALLHAAGAETAGRLRQTLQARGFHVESMVLYEAAPVASLPAIAAEALKAGTLDAVMLFSPRSARIFAGLADAAACADACARLQAFCISPATAAALSPLTFARVAVAGIPNQDAILALLSPPASGA